MIKLIVGKKGSGKTKQLIDLVNSAAQDNSGSIICIEQGHSLTYDIHYGARLIDYSEFPLSGYGALTGFLYGCYAQNYDLVHVFIDNLTKVAQVDNDQELIDFLTLLSEKSESLKINFTITISRDASELPEEVQKYL